MFKEIFISVISGVIVALLAVFGAAAMGLLDKVVEDTQVRIVSREIINKEEYRDVLLDKMEKSGKFLGKQGKRGEKGEQGDKGPQGDPGIPGLTPTIPINLFIKTAPDGKAGNNGTVSCNTFCLGDTTDWWKEPKGVCISAKLEQTGATTTCENVPGLGNRLLCGCASI